MRKEILAVVSLAILLLAVVAVVPYALALFPGGESPSSFLFPSSSFFLSPLSLSPFLSLSTSLPLYLSASLPLCLSASLPRSPFFISTPVTSSSLLVSLSLSSILLQLFFYSIILRSPILDSLGHSILYFHVPDLKTYLFHLTIFYYILYHIMTFM